MEGSLTPGMAEDELAPTTTFRSRLAAFRARLQAVLDERPADAMFEPRLPVRVRLTVDDLAALLPPAERRLLGHLRARKPLRGLVGLPGYRSQARLSTTLQRLLSRVQVYCGAQARHSLMAPYDRPGHHHRRRVGRPRSLIPRDRLPPLILWVPDRDLVFGNRVLTLRRGHVRQPLAAGLSFLLPHRLQPVRRDSPPRKRGSVRAVAISWPDLLVRAAPWLSPLTS